MRSISPQLFSSVVALGLIACAGADDGVGAAGSSGSGGGASGGGGTQSATGGTVSAGGTAPSGGGSGAVPSSGGGGTQSGGSGGTAPGGGGNGGGTACTNIRPTGTEWDEATCDQWATETSECGNAWMIDGNYCNESCGRCSSGGSGGSGNSGGSGGTGAGGSGAGGSGTGGSGPVVIPDTCSEPDGTVCNNQSGRHCGYTYEYWKDQGSGCLTNKSNGFSVEWNNINNLLGRKGIRPGSRNQVVTYDANFQPNGSSYLCIYGWTRNPLVEYYIVDSWGDWRPPGGQAMGTISSDGGTYEIYRTERVNAPSIEGNRTFYQYWSVRTEKRESGTITVANHFNGWEGAGLAIGSLYEVSMTVEGYQSSGSADVAMIME